MKNKISFVAVLMLLCALVFTSCSTTIRAEIERPAELDLNGADTIAVLPIQVSEGGYYRRGGVVGSIVSFFSSSWISEDEVNVTNYIKNGLEEGLLGSQYIDLVMSDAVLRALNSGAEIPCDVYLAGTISNFNSRVEDGVQTVRRGNVNVRERIHWREVSFDFSYQIIDAKTNTIISIKNVQVSSKSGNYNDAEWRNIPDTLSCVRYELNNVISTIMKQLQPYTEIKTLTLLKDKSKDPDMKTADSLAKKGLITEARNLFLDIYASRGYFEAGYNAAIILEGQGDFEGAYAEMQALVTKFGDSKAIAALKDIQREIDSKNALEEQLAK